MQTIIILLVAALIIFGLMLVLLLSLSRKYVQDYVNILNSDDQIQEHIAAINQRLIERKIDLRLIDLQQQSIQDKHNNNTNNKTHKENL